MQKFILRIFYYPDLFHKKKKREMHNSCEIKVHFPGSTQEPLQGSLDLGWGREAGPCLTNPQPTCNAAPGGCQRPTPLHQGRRPPARQRRRPGKNT